VEFGKIGIHSRDPLLQVTLLKDGMESLGIGIIYTKFAVTPIVKKERLVGYLVESLEEEDTPIAIRSGIESVPKIYRYY
jgi:hypothetical protein